jgi:hypothetical protein
MPVCICSAACMRLTCVQAVALQQLSRCEASCVRLGPS